MSNDTQHFNDIANTLMDELSLVSDKEQNHEVFKVEKDLNAETGEIVLNEDELDFINYCVPDEFLKESGLNVNCYRDHLEIVQKENPEAIKVLISKLFNSGHTLEYVNVAEEEQEYYQPIEVLLHDLRDGVITLQKEHEIYRRFREQSDECKINIIRAVIKNEKYDSHWCYWVLREQWWDDALIPDVEKAWESNRDWSSATVICKRFPYEYVKAYQMELGMVNYEAVCSRLARDKDFTINKQRLSRYEYFWILAQNRIHLNEKEADNLLFGHIKECLQRLKESVKEDWVRYVDVEPVEGRDYTHQITRLLDCKPTVLLLPSLREYGECLILMGNTNTLMKLIKWNRFLQSNTPSFMELNQDEAIPLGQIQTRFNAYMDKSWRHFLELAIREFPVDGIQDDEFGVSEDPYLV